MKDVRRDIERGIRDTAPNNLSVVRLNWAECVLSKYQSRPKVGCFSVLFCVDFDRFCLFGHFSNRPKVSVFVWVFGLILTDFSFRSFFNSSLSSFFPLSSIFFPLSSTVPCILGNGLVVVCTITSRKSILLFFCCKCWSTDVPWYIRVESFVFEW